TGSIQWQSSLTAVGGFNDIVGQTSAILPSGSISNTTTMYYQAVVTSGVCPSATVTATVNVDPTSVSGTASIASGTATICSSSTAPTITLAGQVGAVVWQSSTTSGSGFADIGSGASPTVSNTTTKYYRAKVTSGVCSIAYSNEILVTINQASNAGTITPVTQTICYNATPTAITISSYTGTIQWQSSLTAVGGYNDLVGQTSATLPSGSISNTTTMYYQAVVTSGVCPSRTITATVNVDPTTVEGTAAITAGNATICANTPAPTITLSGSVGTIQWLRSGTLTGTYTSVAGTLTPTISNTTTGYYKASVRSGVCLTRETAPILITVDPVSNYGSISQVTQTICYNATPTAIILTGYTGTIQWQFTNIAGGTPSDMVGQTGATLPITAIDKTVTGYYRAVVTSGVCTPAVINSTVNVTELSSAGVATITSGNATICSNTAGPVINLTGSIVGDVQWWERPSASLTLTQNNTQGAAAPIINQTASKYYKAIVTNGICPSAISNEILVTVDEGSSAGTVNLPTQTICYNATPTALTLTGSRGIIQWQSSLTPNSGFNDLAGQTNATLPSGSISNTTSQYYKAVVTNGVCPSATLTATVNVDLATVAGTATGTATICANSPAPTITLSGNVGSVIWQSATTSGGTYTTVAGTNTPTVDVTATKYYRALVKSGVCTASPSNEILVTVDQASRTGTLNLSTQTICYNATPTALTLTNSLGTVKWQSSLTPNSGYNDIVGQTSSTLPSGSISNTDSKYYLAEVTNGVCAAATITATVNVSPTTVAGTATLAGTSTICYGTLSGSLPSITLTGNTGTVQWQSSTSQGGVYTNTTGTSSPVIDNGTSKYYRALVTSGACASLPSNELFVSVDQPSVPGNISPSTQDICIGNTPTPISLTGYVGTIQWQSSTTNSSGTFTNMVGETNNGLVASSIDNTTTKYYQAIIKNGVCPATPSIVAAVNISQLPVPGNVSLAGNSTVCYGTTGAGLPVITLSGSSGNIQWQSSSTSNGVYTNTAGTTSPVIDNTATKYYQAKVSSGPCGSATSIPIVVNVDPLSVAGSINNPTPRICQASTPADLTLTGYTGTIQWQYASLGGTYTNMAGLTSAILPSASIYNNSTFSYKAVVTSGVCPSATVTSTVTVDPTSVAGTATLAGASTVCYGTATASLPVISLAGNVGTIQWQSSTTLAGAYANAGGTNSPVIDNTTSKYYRAQVTSGVCVPDNSAPILVSVDPTSQVAPIVSSEKIQEWCIGSPASSVTLPSYTGNIIWQTANTAGGTYTTIVGQTSATLPNSNIPTTTAGTLFYKAVVKSGVCQAVESDIISVQTDPATVAGTIASSSNLICNGSTPPTITLTGNTGSTIKWQTRRASAVYVNPIPSQTGTSISSVVNNSAPGTVQVVDYYQAIVKSGVCNSLTTNEVMVAIDPTSQVGLIDPLQKTQEVCIGSPATSVVLPTYTGTIQWQSASTGSAYGNMAGLTSATLPFGNILTNVAGTTTYRAQVTSGVCPAIYSEIVSVQTDAATVAGDAYYLKGSSPICNLSEKPTISIKNNTGSNIVWQITTVSNSSSVIGTANSLNYTNTINTGNFLNSAIDNTAPGAISSFKYYRASVRNGVCKTEYTAPIELEVIPTPLVTKVVPAERCGPGIVELYAESNLGIPNWYEASTGGSAVGGANSFTTPFLNSSTNYYAGAIFRGCVSFDRTAVLAKIKPIPSITSVTNATYCGPGYLELSATTSGGVINWFTNASGGTSLLTASKYTTPLIRNTTTYYAEALQDGCTSAPRSPVVATIFEVPTVTPLPDLFSLCAGLRVSLKNNAALGVPPYSYTFYTNNGNVLGQKDGYLLGVKGGVTNVYFNVKDMNGCVSQNTNTFQVKTYDPVLPQRFNYQAFYKDNFVIPTKLDSGYVIYNWQPGLNLNYYDKPNPIFNGENTTDYVLVRTDTTSKCTVADNYHIDVTRDFIFDLPNAFTPNYDGLNDVIKSIKNAGIDKVTSLSIFNRYGTKVCCTMSEIENGWNGAVNGKVQDSDGYFWIATFETKDGRTLTKRGSFLLIK
ncbi:MAG: hypothetical protein RLZ95_1155, partial [Bacteroidota bacterium]